MAGLLEHRIPDVVSTADLPVPLAAEIDFLAGRVDRWLAQSREVSAAISARSLAFLGRASEARGALDQLDVAGAGPLDLSSAAWAASRVGGSSVAPLLARLELHGDDFVNGEVPAGPTKLFTGMLRGASGDLVGASVDLAVAVEVGDARAPLWGALGRVELGRVLQTAEAVPLGLSASAHRTLTAARTFFVAGGYTSLTQRVAEASAPVSATLLLGGPCSIGFGVQPPVDVRASKGLTALHHLIANNHRVVTAAELAMVLDGGDADEIASLMPDAWQAAAGRTDDHHDHDDDHGDDLDRSADDVSAAIRRVFFDDAIRSRVSKLLRRTIDKLGESSSPLSCHLQAAVRTGHGCRYAPAGPPVHWQLADR